MSSRNIDRFNEITGLIFGQLYEAFPIPIRLRPELIGIEEREGAVEGLKEAEALCVAVQSEEVILFKHSVTWLIQAEYLHFRHGDPGSGHFNEARLTAKGLEVLNAIPIALTKREPLGEQLVAASKSGGKALVRSITTEALGFGARLGMKAFGIDA
jgi:hypothetical protein